MHGLSLFWSDQLTTVNMPEVASASCLNSKMKKITVFPSGCVHSGHMDTLIGSAYYEADSMHLYH